ncbi:hypothetical protein [Nocardioides sp. Leaf285]|uniref:hypothetical protein n=1 Tax=Nocardioides sp. Leaf285 TaxID=1736322 RepID=UPI000A80B9CD|nr:hypothetical protein [Nocardioides sp. Leaf285]
MDLSEVNGTPPQPGVAYCTRCATALADVGWFAPNPGQQPLPDLTSLMDPAEPPA